MSSLRRTTYGYGIYGLAVRAAAYRAVNLSAPLIVAFGVPVEKFKSMMRYAPPQKYIKNIGLSAHNSTEHKWPFGVTLSPLVGDVPKHLHSNDGTREGRERAVH